MAVRTDGLPSSIRVGVYDIAIVLCEPEEMGDDYGSFESQEQRIKLLREFKTAALALDTVVHELLHAAWFAASLPGRCGEERAVSGLSPHLAHILRDNCELFEWIKATIAR